MTHRTGDGHGQRLSALDSSFLRLESPAAHMHIGWSATFSVPAGVARPTLEALRDRVAGRLHRVPRCRQRLCPAPLGVGDPRWMDDPDFDLTAHVTAPIGPEEAVPATRFADLRDGLLADPLDRRRPLWHVALVPRLADGRVGVVGRVHHAMADGASALQIAMLLLDAGDADRPPTPWVPRQAPGTARWLLDPFADGAGLAARAVKAAAVTIRRPRSGAREVLDGAGRAGLALREDLAPRAPRSWLNAPTGPRRTLIGCQVPFAELPEDGTLNDIGLAIVAGALRRLAVGCGGSVQPLKAMVPVDVRRADEHAELGNRISSVAVWLPLHLSVPAARLAAVRDQTQRFKHERRPQGVQTLMAGLGMLHGPLRDAAVRAAAAPRAYNLVVSSVAGPSTAVTMLGARLRDISPVVPIGRGHPLAVGMLSYDRALHLGVHADPDALPDLAALPARLAEELAQLRGPGGSRGTVTSISARRFARTAAAADPARRTS